LELNASRTASTHSLIPYSPSVSPQVKNKDGLERERKKEEEKEEKEKKKKKINTSSCILISR
jgi:ribosomal protein S9